jgi:hypothetical protein
MIIDLKQKSPTSRGYEKKELQMNTLSQPDCLGREQVPFAVCVITKWQAHDSPGIMNLPP